MRHYVGQPPFQWQGDINTESAQSAGLVAWWPISVTPPAMGIYNAIRRQIDPFPASSANHPTFVVQPGAEKIGRTLSFSATGYTDSNRDYVSFPAISLGVEQTLVYWLAYNKYTSLAYGGVVLGYDNNYYFDWISGTTRYASFGSGNIVSVSSGIVTGTLSHLAIVRSGTSAQFYLNGLPDGGVQTLGANNALTLSILGAATTVANSYYGYKGTIGDTRIYNRALSAKEIWSLYDPPTRWELYATPEYRRWFVPSVASEIIPLIMHHRRQQAIS